MVDDAVIPRAKETVIVVHGINSSRHNFDTLMPAAMLARAGFNVLLMDLRDQGETTCEDGRHSAGQDESDDIITAAYWLKSMKAIPLFKNRSTRCFRRRVSSNYFCGQES